MKSPKPTLPIRISLYNICILLHNIIEAHKKLDLEGVDPDKTKEDLIRSIDKPVYVHLDAIQSALYYCNLLSETGEFWHPNQLEFNTFLVRILPSDLEFDKTYNIVHNKIITSGEKE